MATLIVISLKPKIILTNHDYLDKAAICLKMKLHFQAYLLGRSMFSWSICFKKKKRERKEKKLVLLRPICPCLQPQPGFVLHTHSVGAETDLNLCFTFDLQYLCINRYLERHGSRILSLCTFLFENCRGTWTQTGIWGHSTTRQLFFVFVLFGWWTWRSDSKITCMIIFM